MKRWLRNTAMSLACLGLTLFVVIPARVALIQAGVNNLERSISRVLLQADKRILAKERQLVKHERSRK